MNKLRLLRGNSATLLIICLTKRESFCIWTWNVSESHSLLFGLLEAFNLSVKNLYNRGVTCKRDLLYYEVKALSQMFWEHSLVSCVLISCVFILKKKWIVVNRFCLSHEPEWLIQGFLTWLCMRKNGRIFLNAHIPAFGSWMSDWVETGEIVYLKAHPGFFNVQSGLRITELTGLYVVRTVINQPSSSLYLLSL